ncbi:hypothetical protein CVIC8964_1285 [Campylobacter vicugnae]|uniref:Uncharacterized protein n=1 Tax=Campylobacter vicugnae TaxID=1660076 RepID=A0A1X9T2B7_9BACT|nr:hypothetical protein [Campylobacter sp. RM8964]ARR02674.1 hypothetical protein CVIC8964_1285 [Campylobacter sp. RM8964]
MDYDNMSTEELEKEFQRVKYEEEVANGKMQTEEEISNENSEEVVKEDEVDENSIEYESSNTEEPIEASEEASQESVKNNDIYTIKANGKEYDMSIDELKQMASKGMDYVKKTTALKPYRTMIAAMEQNGLSAEDINLLIDLKKGNKEAIAKIVSDSKIDVYDIPDSSDYTPTEYRVHESQLDMKEMIADISKDSEFSRTSDIYSKLDENSKTAINNNPAMLAGLHQDIKSGLFDQVLPYAEKRAMIDGYSQPFLKYYMEAGSEYLKNVNTQNQIKSQQQIKATTPINRDNKLAASLPSARADKKTVIDYLDEELSDEDYHAWRSKLQRQY